MQKKACTTVHIHVQCSTQYIRLTLTVGTQQMSVTYSNGIVDVQVTFYTTVNNHNVNKCINIPRNS